MVSKLNVMLEKSQNHPPVSVWFAILQISCRDELIAYHGLNGVWKVFAF